MSDRTTIEWTDASWNCLRARDRVTGKVGWHCVHASEACRFCYAEGFNLRLGTQQPYKPGMTTAGGGQVETFLDERVLLQPLRWRRPRKIFPCSMTDLFGAWVPNEDIDRIFAVMALAAAHHTWQPLTKRPERASEYLLDMDREPAIGVALGNMLDGSWVWGEGKKHRDRIENLIDDFTTSEPLPLPNVWIGTSIEDQATADERREPMRALAEAGWLTWVSYEPALGPIDWRGWEFLRWVVSGGESGPQARPSHPDWHRAARDFCLVNDIAYFFKQWGVFAPYGPVDNPLGPDAPDDRYLSMALDRVDLQGRMQSSSHYEPRGAWRVSRVGKKAAGRLLDGVEHNGFPVAHRS